MAGSLAISNVFAGNSPSAVSKLDTDLSVIASYVNLREVTQGTIAARPAAGTAGAWYLATDTSGGTLYADNGVAWIQVAAAVAGGIIYTDHLTGLGLSFNTGTILNIAAGAAASNDAVIANRVLMTLAIFTKTTAVWAVGTGNGGLATGVAIANSTWYHVFLIRRTDTSVVDVAFDTSVTGANIAANTNVNYTKLRRIGSFLTSGAAAIINFVQDGDQFYWNASVLDVNTANPGTAAVLSTLSVPLGLKVEAICNVSQFGGTTTNIAMVVSSPDQSDEAPSVISAASVAPLSNAGLYTTAAAYAGLQMRVRTNTVSQIRYRLSASGALDKVYIATVGWVDRRGRG